jgi:hypothetical protein
VREAKVTLGGLARWIPPHWWGRDSPSQPVSNKEVELPKIEEIRRVKDEFELDLMQLPGVTGVDIGPKYVDGQDTGILAIRIYVERKEDLPEELTLPKEIQGIPTDVIERSFSLHPIKKQGSLLNHCAPQDDTQSDQGDK